MGFKGRSLETSPFTRRRRRKWLLPAHLLGTLIAAVAVLAGGDAGASDRNSSGAFPLAPQADRGIRAVPATFFGMTVGKLGVHYHWPGMHTRILRLWDTHTRWMDLEPAKGQWNFRRIDKYVDFAQQNGADVLLTLGQTPAWAAADHTAKCHYGVGCSQPANLQDWRDYVRTLANRYGSRVRYWELWNEPDNPPFWRGSPQQLAIMAGIAREEILKANPDAKLIGPGLGARGFAFLDSYLAAGGGDSIDALSFHSKPNESLDEVTNTITRIRSITKARDFERLPLWNSEFGITCRKPSRVCGKGDEATNSAIERVLASLFVMAAEDIQSVDFYFFERGVPSSPFGLAYPPSYTALTPAGQAYEQAVSLLDGATVTESYDDHGVLVIEFNNSGRDYVALWNEGKPRSLQLPQYWNFSYKELVRGGEITSTRERRLEIPSSTLVIGSE